MENTNDVLSDLKDIASGLKRIGKNRKVVLPHHKEFELIEYLFNESKKFKNSSR